MKSKRKSKIMKILDIFIIIIIIIFIYGCYNFEFLKNNKSIVSIKEKFNVILSDLNIRTNDSLSYIIENYESDNDTI